MSTTEESNITLWSICLSGNGMKTVSGFELFRKSEKYIVFVMAKYHYLKPTFPFQRPTMV